MDIIDLDHEREQRAAQREASGKSGPVKIGGKVVAELPVELPLDVLAPLQSLDADLTLVLREAMNAARNRGAETAYDATETVIEVLAANPALPSTALATIKECAALLLTPEGLAGLLEARPSAQDYVALAKGVFRFYGVTLGEAFTPIGSPETDGETSSTTSEPSSDSTPEGSTDDPATKDSLESVGS